MIYSRRWSWIHNAPTSLGIFPRWLCQYSSSSVRSRFWRANIPINKNLLRLSLHVHSGVFLRPSMPNLCHPNSSIKTCCGLNVKVNEFFVVTQIFTCGTGFTASRGLGIKGCINLWVIKPHEVHYALAWITPWRKGEGALWCVVFFLWISGP